MSKNLKVILLAITIVLLGFLRDYFFMNINWVYLNLTTGRPNQALPEFHFLLQWSVPAIENLKWILTFVFSLLFLANTLIIIHINFRNKFYNLLTLGVYVFIMLTAGVLFLIASFTRTMTELYGIIRTLMGMVQSFMPLMFLFILFKFLPASPGKK